jgi:aspartyl-tRNA(Asn)/glutamyl-tRNA(Gln) amidotransferase subunit C
MHPIHTSSSEHIDVRYVAHLARVRLTDQEIEEFQSQLGDILGYVDQLKQLDVDGVEPTAHAVPLENVLGDDECRPGLDRETVLRNAPAVYLDQFDVPAILED